MSKPILQNCTTALLAAGLLCAPALVDAKPRYLQVSSGGTTTDVTYQTTTTTTTTDVSTTSATTTTAGYLSTLVNGYTPSTVSVGGRTWRVNAGATWSPNMDRSLKKSTGGGKFRVEIWDTTNDHSSNDGSSKRRSELSGSLPGDSTRLPNGVPLWGATSFIHQSWADPAGMKATTGGVYGQIHMGSTLGGSPAVAFRRTASGAFRITTRGENDLAGTVRYQGALSFDRVHDLVYQVVLDPLKGSLKVWVDGVNVVNVSNVSIGSQYADSYWNLGVYFSGGITCPIVAEYGNVVYPSSYSLSWRTTSAPAWPTS